MLKRYGSSVFVKGFMLLFAGSAVAQLIPLFLSPFISRSFSVEDIGVFGLYFSLVSTFSVIASGRYEMSIVLPKSNEDSIRLVYLSVIVAFFTAVVSLILIILFGSEISELLNNKRIQDWLILIPLSLFSVGVYQAFNFWLIRQKAFMASSFNKLAQRSLEGVSTIFYGLTIKGAGLIFSDVIGRYSMLLIAIYQARKRGFFQVSFSWSEMKRLAIFYRSFPINFGLSSLANSAGAHLPILFISIAFQSLTVGYFNLMKYVLSAPVAFISRNIAQVFLERLAEKWRSNQPVSSDFIRLTGLMTGIAILFVLPILVFGEDIFQLAFGEGWGEAGLYAQIMVVSFGLRFVVSPLSSLLNAINKVNVASYWQWAYFLSILSLVPVSRLDITILDFLIYYTSIESVMYIIYWILIYYQAKSHDEMLINDSD